MAIVFEFELEFAPARVPMYTEFETLAMLAAAPYPRPIAFEHARTVLHVFPELRPTYTLDFESPISAR
jgi:hypothetical protein